MANSPPPKERNAKYLKIFGKSRGKIYLKKFEVKKKDKKGKKRRSKGTHLENPINFERLFSGCPAMKIRFITMLGTHSLQSQFLITIYAQYHHCSLFSLLHITFDDSSQ